MGITIERITPAIGPIVSGVDLAQPVDPQTRSAITDAPGNEPRDDCWR